MRKLLCAGFAAVFLLCPGIVPLMAQTPVPSPSAPAAASQDELLQKLKASALVFTVNATIDNDGTVLWSADQTRVTVNGLSVSLRMESSELLILAELTPYRQVNGQVLLVIKNELWLRSAADGSMQYYASLKSTLVDLGKPVYFYPLGRTTGEGRSGIQLEIRVDNYRDVQN